MNVLYIKYKKHIIKSSCYSVYTYVSVCTSTLFSFHINNINFLAIIVETFMGRLCIMAFIIIYRKAFLYSVWHSSEFMLPWLF